YNFETEEGRSALAALFRAIMKGEEVPGLEDARQTLRDMGLITIRDGVEVVRREDETNVPRFLNRVLALEVARQTAIFNYFYAQFEIAVSNAKANGTFDEGVTDIHAVAVRLARAPRVVATDPTTGAQTQHYTLDVDRRTDALQFEEAETQRRSRHGGYIRHVKKGHVVLATPSRLHTDADTGETYRTFLVWTPEGKRDYHREGDLAQRFQPIPPDEAREWWVKRLAEVPEIETTPMHIIGGAILPLWQRLKREQESRLRVVRVSTDDGRRIVGAQ